MNAVNTINSGINDVNNTLRASQNAYNKGMRLVGANGKPAAAPSSQGLELQGQQGASVLESAVQLSNGKKYFSVPAPTGTRIIIPRQVSSTGQERYLGAHALESVMNLMQGSEKCGNIVVLNNQRQPSSLYYDIGPEGEIFLKGTNKEIKLSHEGSNASVILSEQEFDVLKKALSTQTNDVTHFRTTNERGNAEDSTAEKGSWFSRNWWKILLGLVIAGGIAWGGIAIHDRQKRKKEEKAAKATASNVTTNSNETSNTSQQATAANAGTNTSSVLVGTNITNEQTPLANTNTAGNSL